jgi:homoserine dehydrogenase
LKEYLWNQVNVGIIGFGTVGSGTVEILLKNRDIITGRVGSEIVIKKIADLDIASDRGLPIASDLLTTDPMEVIRDPSVHIVVELIGGLTHAKDFILKAMEAGKHVVTANKALLAECGGEIYQAAEKYGVSLAYEASVGGGIPVIRSLREGLSANRIQTIMGILNGTSNYILSRMSQNGLPYKGRRRSPSARLRRRPSNPGCRRHGCGPQAGNSCIHSFRRACPFSQHLPGRNRSPDP